MVVLTLDPDHQLRLPYVQHVNISDDLISLLTAVEHDHPPVALVDIPPPLLKRLNNLDDVLNLPPDELAQLAQLLGICFPRIGRVFDKRQLQLQVEVIPLSIQ